MASPSILITGAGGFVGSYLIKELQTRASWERIIGIDKEIDSIPDSVVRHKVDIADSETYVSIIASEKPTWIIHLAAISSVGFAIEHPDITRAVNVDGTRTLLERTRSISPDTKFLVISSADIYGHVDGQPLRELPLADCHPANPYAESKLAMEQLIEKDHSDVCIRVRPFPHIGPGQKQGFVTADFASQIAAIERGEQEPTMLVGSLDTIRDFTDVRDVVRAYCLLLEKGELGNVYHVASGKGTAIADILHELVSYSSVSIAIKQDEKRVRPSDNPVIIGDATKLYKQTLWKPAISLSQSLREILDYWRKSE
ncbi:MAG: hypothetical protein A3E36_03985 [Candidatus Andersenbacteria bacterium RIFCSPHIGHO2_12_FULL_45_11b]|uniref:NAD(P)-binding domain-containing protein n=1 Tax=Candidatus Andersenbacteria bacterium RIFCSPHIGHO2_12_FULL_45_11b TaxID=1797282 RepID=A0A1G1XBP8_9BACT|nr:MAG: hypothetical protein A3E36_03985 [Candidatus Andersenbacteria bacterium RIFCSPHIGHO2_12_FULL_45_11b]